MKFKNLTIFLLSFILFAGLLWARAGAQESYPLAPLPTIPPQSNDKIAVPEYEAENARVGPTEERAMGSNQVDNLEVAALDVRDQLIPLLRIIAIINFIVALVVLLAVKKKFLPRDISQGKKRLVYGYVCLNCLNLLFALVWIFGVRFYLYEVASSRFLVIIACTLFFSWGMGVINILFLLIYGVRQVVGSFKK